MGVLVCVCIGVGVSALARLCWWWCVVVGVVVVAWCWLLLGYCLLLASVKGNKGLVPVFYRYNLSFVNSLFYNFTKKPCFETFPPQYYSINQPFKGQ